MALTAFQRAICRTMADTRHDSATLSREWHAALDAAREVVGLLPSTHVGHAVLDGAGGLFGGSPADLADALAAGSVRYHEGRIKGALPVIVR